MNTKERFDEWSKTYDSSLLQKIFFNPTHERMLKEILPRLKQGSRILDVACGTGQFEIKLFQATRLYLDIHGTDISEGMIEKAKEKIDFAIWKVAEADNLPYEDDYFDVVVCSHAFHHFPRQLVALHEMKRVVKSGGIVIICDGHKDSIWGKIVFGIVDIIEKNVYHNNKSSMISLYKATCFKNIKSESFNKIAPILITMGEK